MKLADHLRRAQDDLIRNGQAVTNIDVFDHAMADPDAAAAFEEEARGRARQSALRSISANLSATVNPTTDPEVVALFDVTDYRPPSCVSIPGDDGEIRHKGIAYADADDLESHAGVLVSNIEAARVKYFDFDQFRKFIGPYIGGGTVEQALARIRDERERRAA